jgi:hypothetical protein
LIIAQGIVERVLQQAASVVTTNTSLSMKLIDACLSLSVIYGRLEIPALRMLNEFIRERMSLRAAGRTETTPDAMYLEAAVRLSLQRASWDRALAVVREITGVCDKTICSGELRLTDGDSTRLTIKTKFIVWTPVKRISSISRYAFGIVVFSDAHVDYLKILSRFF